MDHLPKGKLFFAKVYSCGEESKWYNFGIRKNQMLLCHMLSSTSEDPLVDVLINGKPVTISGEYSNDWCWMVYEGNKDLTGFICRDSIAEAKKILIKLGE